MLSPVGKCKLTCFHLARHNAGPNCSFICSAEPMNTLLLLIDSVPYLVEYFALISIEFCLHQRTKLTVVRINIDYLFSTGKVHRILIIVILMPLDNFIG